MAATLGFKMLRPPRPDEDHWRNGWREQAFKSEALHLARRCGEPVEPHLMTKRLDRVRRLGCVVWVWLICGLWAHG